MQYEEQISEYERHLEEAAQRTQAVQNQLVELEKVKSSHDLKANEAIDALKEDYEQQYAQLQNQLTELQDRDLRPALTKLDEEKVAHEKQLNETISTLQQSLENVQTEMNDRGLVMHVFLSLIASVDQ